MLANPDNSLHRLSGFVIVANTLLPALLVLLISAASALFTSDYLNELRAAATQMQKTAGNAATAVAAVAKNVKTHATTAQFRLEGITKKVGKKKAKVDVVISDIEKGLKRAKVSKKLRNGLTSAFDKSMEPFDSVSDLSKDFKKIGAEIKRLDKLKPLFNQIATNAGKLAGLFSSLAAWWELLWFTLLVIAAWAVLSYVLWAKRRLAYGVALMRGGHQLSTPF